MFKNIFNNIQGRLDDISKPRLFIMLLVFFVIIFLSLKFIAGFLFSSKKTIDDSLKNDSFKIDDSVEIYNPDAQLAQREEGPTTPQSDINNVNQMRDVSPSEIVPIQSMNEMNEKKLSPATQPNSLNTNDSISQQKVQQKPVENKIKNSTKSSNEQSLPDPVIAKNKKIFEKIVKPRIEKKIKEKNKQSAKGYEGSNVKSSSGKYKVQLLAYNDPMQAKVYAKKYRSNSAFAGKQFFISHKIVRGKNFYAVQVGVFNSKVSALDFCKKIKSQKKVQSCFLIAA